MIVGSFQGSDPFEVVLLVRLSDGRIRLMNYHIPTELLTNLTWLNIIPGFH
ncbi:hypothetical protein D3C72_2176190 [compost metagenome]